MTSGRWRLFPRCATTLLHLEKLEALFRNYGFDLPNTRCREPIPHFSTIPQAVAAALNAERQNVDIYERLEGTAREPALRQQIVNLEHAAADQRVPSLEACAEETARARTDRRTRKD